MKLEGYISELLQGHNCVIVPDFGGFVANYKSAVIDKYSKKIHPPSKAVLFNPKLTTNDGLLGNHVSQSQNISYPEALSFISDQVAVWQKSFEQGQRIEIGEIGFLYSEHGKVHFEQSREVNLLLQAYGLRSIDFVTFGEVAKSTKPITDKNKVEKETPKVEARPKKQQPNKYVTLIDEPIIEEKTEEKVVPKKEKAVVQEEIPTQKKVVEVEQKEETKIIALNQEEKIEKIVDESSTQDGVVPIKRNRGVTILKYAAAVAFVPILFYSYWIPMETDALETSSIQITDFNPVATQKKPLYHDRDQVFFEEQTEAHADWDELTENINAAVYNFELAEDFYVPIKLSEETEPLTTIDDNTSTEDINVEEPEVHVNTTGPYHVIAGCFSVKSNAENQVKELQSQGFSAAILDKSGGLHRVTAGNYADRDAAKRGLEKVKGSGQSGWILKK